MRATRKARFITPALGELLFWSLAVSIGLVAFFGSAASPFVIGVGIAAIVVLRVAFELVTVIFACHQEIETIRMHLQSGGTSAAPSPPQAVSRPLPVSPLAIEQAAKAAKAKELAEKLERAREIDRQRDAVRPPSQPGEHRLE
jgi:hypothetical protein